MPDAGSKVLVVGATGGSGRAAVEALLAAGHRVTAFARRPQVLSGGEGLTPLAGDATSAAQVAEAVRGHEAVIVTLGITENPLRVRALGPARTPIDVRSAGTRNVIAAMQQHGVRRLVVQSSYGVGATRDRLRPIDRLFFALILKPQIADTEEQERAVRHSELDWVLAQPVHLTDGPEEEPFLSTRGETDRMSVSRRSVGRFLAAAVARPDLIRQSVAISGSGR